jgi:hypothetical protein
MEDMHSKQDLKRSAAEVTFIFITAPQAGRCTQNQCLCSDNVRLVHASKKNTDWMTQANIIVNHSLKSFTSLKNTFPNVTPK